jgi:hypothetical protein
MNMQNLLYQMQFSFVLNHTLLIRPGLSHQFLALLLGEQSKPEEQIGKLCGLKNNLSLSISCNHPAIKSFELDSFLLIEPFHYEVSYPKFCPKIS